MAHSNAQSIKYCKVKYNVRINNNVFCVIDSQNDTLVHVIELVKAIKTMMQNLYLSPLVGKYDIYLT